MPRLFLPILDWLNPPVIVTTVRLLLDILLFYVFIVVVVEGTNIARAFAISLKALRTTWLEALLGTGLLGSLVALIEAIYTWIRRSGATSHLFDPVTGMPNAWWKLFTTTEFCCASLITLASFVVFRTLLYKQYKAGI